MDLFFRQFWMDKRLAFKGTNELVVSADFLNQIWVPDTYIGINLLMFSFIYFFIHLILFKS